MYQQYQEDEAKSKRISFQSIFSSLCNLYQHTTPADDLVADLEKMANDINKRLHTNYPQTTNTTAQAPKAQCKPKFEATGDYKCDFCGANLVKTKAGNAFRCPNWKKDGSGCKGTYVDPQKIKQANYQDSIDEESHQQHYDNHHTDTDIPPEFGGR